jgi:hypothetical protein
VNFATRPFNLIALSGFVLLFLSVFIHPQTIDIHLYDTYFIISLGYLCWAFCLVQFILWGLYRFLSPILFPVKMIWPHVLISSLIPAGIILYSWRAIEFYNPRPTSYIDYTFWDSFKKVQYSAEIIALALAIYILAQFLFFLNIVMQLLKKSA